MGNFRAANPLPLVEAIRWDEAPALLPGCLECRFARNGLGARIDEAAADLCILRPTWNEPPARKAEPPRILVEQDGHLLCGSDIVACNRSAAEPHFAELVSRHPVGKLKAVELRETLGV